MRSHRLVVEVRGAVQGVGFRPFLYRIATELGLRGAVRNDSDGVHLDLEGDRRQLEELLRRLEHEAPPLAVVHSVVASWCELVGHAELRIDPSESHGAPTVVVLADVASCARCLSEVADPRDRRHRYPFTNCTDCGPRFSIVESLPYDRPNTTMRGFSLCTRCRREYEDPADRRFHAQPNACPQCGPQLALLDALGSPLERGDRALRAAAAALGTGRIVAVKGLGGFHLMVDAGDGEAVARLRQRKERPFKPLALMVPDLAAARALCEVPDAAALMLTSYQAPIVLLSRREDDTGGGAAASVADAVAPGNPHLGLMLPANPLHRLLLDEVGRAVVATSGNLSDEPICTDNDDALQRLAGIADLFLVHDRPIARHVDDSVGWLHGSAPQWIRRARGLAPLPVRMHEGGATVLAVGAHFKNVVALAVDDNVFLSQHIGDMETPQARGAFERVIDDFLRLYDARPVAVAHDLHPHYASTTWAWKATDPEANASTHGRLIGRTADRLVGLPCLPVQHHHAHLASCLAEHGRTHAALGVTWDGTGLGTDGTIWGGEFLRGDAAGACRVGRLRPFRLPGGDAAARRPAVVAVSLLYQTLGEEALERTDLAPVAALSDAELRLLPQMLLRGVRSPWTTSAGRLFDGVASILGICQSSTFEGEAAMALEYAAARARARTAPMPMPLQRVVTGTEDPAVDPPTEVLELDWRPLVATLLAQLRAGHPPDELAARFHATLAEGIVAMAVDVGEGTVALTGGCFQNRTLGEAAARKLRAAGMEPLVQRQVPPNDGGVSLGQVAVARARLRTATGG